VARITPLALPRDVPRRKAPCPHSEPMTAKSPSNATAIEELKALLHDRVSTSLAIREHHGHDESYLPDALPDAVVFPESTEEVRDIVAICRRHLCPIVPFGAGTSLEGHVLAVRGGVCVDMSRMNRIVAVHAD